MSQTWNAKQYSNHAAFVAKHGAPLLELLDINKGKRLLDLGCGDGALSLEIRNLGFDVHGVDSSHSMISLAHERGLSAEVMSGDKLTFEQEFNWVFSNAALHWMKNSEAVIQGVFESLKEGGHFVAEFGSEGNINVLLSAMEEVFSKHTDFGDFVNPWYFPAKSIYKSQLEEAGFEVLYIEEIPRPTPLESGVKEWLKIFSNGITAHLTDEQIAIFLEEVEDSVRPRLFDGSQWVADYVRLRFVACKVR